MTAGSLLLTNHSFEELLQTDTEMMRLRDEYRAIPANERRMAAEHCYENDIPNPFTHLLDPEAPPFVSGNGSTQALAIDPLYAPAMLTVGSIEHQLGRAEAAMDMFMRLLKLPVDTDDLHVIIDKVGDFLIDQEDFENSLRLYQAASETFPDAAVFHSGLGYCADKMGNMSAAVEHSRRAVAMDVTDAELLSDLGWCLIRAGDYEEAEAALLQSLAKAPDNERTQANLDYLCGIQRGEKQPPGVAG